MNFLEKMKGVGVESLNLTQRILLATDGTLTNMLEAIFCEGIRIEKCGLEKTPASTFGEALGLEAESGLIKRTVLLVGCSTRRRYVYAETLLVASRVPPSLYDGLMNTNAPLGQLWATEQREAFKDCLLACRTSSPIISQHLQTQSELLMRTYRLTSSGRPMMLISEWFPSVYPTQP